MHRIILKLLFYQLIKNKFKNTIFIIITLLNDLNNYYLIFPII